MADFSYTFSPGSTSIQSTLTGTDSDGNPISITESGSSPTFPNVPGGTYTLSYTDPTGTYQDGSTSVTMDDEEDTFDAGTLIATSDSGTNTPATDATANQFAADQPEDSIILTPPNPENIYTNSSFEGYYTAAQVNCYVGSLHIDELVSIQFALQHNAIPIYGWASRDFDALGKGRALVQGQLCINYVTEGFMTTVVDSAADNQSDDEADDDASTDAADAANIKTLVAQQSAISASNSPNASAMQNNVSNRLQQSLATCSPAAVAAAAKTTKSLGRGNVFTNAVYRNNTFDLVIQIGTGPAKTERRIEMCKIISNEQIVAQDGQTLVDCFGFIGRRLR